MPVLAPKSELALVVGFLAVIAGVPLAQTGLELARGERVQFTDVFRRRPTEQRLRQFEQTLEEKSWFQQRLRPAVQRFLFATLRDPGAKAVLGLDHWLFYRPDLRYLLDAPRPGSEPAASPWVSPGAPRTPQAEAGQAIVRFRDQLRERGIALVVMPVPGKPSVYPDRLAGPGAGRAGAVPSPTSDLLRRLERDGVPVVDLFTIFAEARAAGGSPEAGGELYLARDTHWTPRGAQLAAVSVAARLRELQLTPSPVKSFGAARVAVRRWGDVLELMQIPGLRDAFPSQTVECLQVADPVLGLLVPGASDRPGTYRYPGQQASVLVLGDSFCRIYQYPEPQTLGEAPDPRPAERRGEAGPKRLLPGSAGFVSHLALALQAPVDSIVSDGGASADVRRRLSTNPEILEGKKVVVWEFVERDLALGRSGWEDVPLPARLD